MLDIRRLLGRNTSMTDTSDGIPFDPGTSAAHSDSESRDDGRLNGETKVGASSYVVCYGRTFPPAAFMCEEPPKSIDDFHDPDGDLLTADTDPLTAYLAYLSQVREGAMGDCGFSLSDFQEYIKSLSK
jgi:hypothetical protein